jgi:hypothetical protein
MLVIRTAPVSPDKRKPLAPDMPDRFIEINLCPIVFGWSHQEKSVIREWRLFAGRGGSGISTGGYAQSNISRSFKAF